MDQRKSTLFWLCGRIFFKRALEVLKVLSWVWFGLVLGWFFFFIFLKNALLVLNWEEHVPFPVFFFLFFKV